MHKSALHTLVCQWGKRQIRSKKWVRRQQLSEMTKHGQKAAEMALFVFGMVISIFGIVILAARLGMPTPENTGDWILSAISPR